MIKNPYVYKKCDELRAPYPDIDSGLTEHYGQTGEDIIISSLLRAWSSRTGKPLQSLKYLEIGANHPFAANNTYLLRNLFDMRGVLVEANSELIHELARQREGDVVVHAAVVDEDVDTVQFYVSKQSELSSIHRRFVEEWRGGEVGISKIETVPALRVNDILRKYFNVTPPVFMAIDIEGADFDILKDVDWVRWRPFLVQTEPSEHFAPGTGDAMVTFMQSVKYELIGQTDINLIFADLEQLVAFSTGVKGSAVLGSSSFRTTVKPFVGYSKNCSVGIVTRTKDRAMLLRRALESINNQTYPHWKLIIVNDGGDPSPVDMLVDAIFKGDSRVSIVHHANSKGMEAASNAGLSLLNTDLAAIHDDDDSWAPEMLSIATQVLRDQNKKLPSVRGVVTNLNAVYETVSGNHIRIDRIETWRAGRHDQLEEGLLDVSKIIVRNQFPPIAFIFDLSICRALEMFDHTLPVLGDWDFHLKFVMRHDIWVHPEALAFYHHRPQAQGVLGNSIHAGHSNHLLYNLYLRNRWFREATADEGPASVLAVLMREIATKLERVEESRYDFERRIPVKLKKTRIGQYLSELNRHRKAWMKRGLK